MLCLQTHRLLLRPLGPEDLSVTHAFSSDPELTKYMVYLPTASEEETARYLKHCREEWAGKNPRFLEFAICLRGDSPPRQIGEISLYFDCGPESAELGWILLPSCQGRGYAREAAEALIQYARSSLSIRHFVAHCDAENVASYHLMEKLGFRRTACTGGRRNRSSNEERSEYTYEVTYKDVNH